MNKVELKAEDIRVNDDKPSGDNLTKEQIQELELFPWDCLLYTSDAADE